MTNKCAYSTNNQPLRIDNEYDTVWFEFFQIQGQTKKQFLICREGLTFWIPRSQISGRPPHKCDNPENWVGIPLWLAGKLGVPREWLFDGWYLTGAEPEDDHYDMAWWEMQ